MAMIPVIDGKTGTANISAIQELMENNATMPDIARVIYNVGMKAYPQIDPQTKKPIKDKDGKVVMTPEVPVLATTVFFIDNTKVSVVNSQNDGVDFEDYKLSNGNVIKVATKESKERGLIYAIMKRLVSKPDDKGKMVDSGLGRILRELVDSAYDTDVAEAESKIAKDAAKKAHAEKQANAKPRNPSMLETVIKLADSQKELAECIKMLREDLNQLKAKLA